MLNSGQVLANTTIDWATFTSTTEKGKSLLYDAFNGMKDHLDDTPREWRWNGYLGLSGEGLSVGARDDGAILRASGNWSNDIVWLLPRKQDIRPTRVDLQVTIRLKRDTPDVAWQIFDNRDEYQAGLKRAPKMTYFTNSDGGQTVYAGKRESPRFIRVYDKWRQSGMLTEWKNCWRFEVELKQAYARSWWDAIVAGDIDLKDTPAIVAAHLEKAGIPVLYDFRECADCIFTSARVSTDDGKLEWLRAQVSPAVAKLIDKGKSEQVLYALFPLLHTRQDLFEPLKKTIKTKGEWGMGEEYSNMTDPLSRGKVQ